MKVAVACDHAGYPMKQTVVEAIRDSGHEAIDLGTDGPESVDYPDFARAAGEAIRSGKAERAVVLCGSGVGASIAASKMRGIRAGVCHDIYSSHQAVEHDDMNVLCLGARVLGPAVVPEIVHSFLAARFTNEDRHVRRLNKVKAIEAEG